MTSPIPRTPSATIGATITRVSGSAEPTQEQIRWRVKPPQNPFRAAWPPAEHRPYQYWGDYALHRRTPEQIREVMERRVARWFDRSFEALPDDIGREDMIACVFGIRGWQIRARITGVDRRVSRPWPVNAWLLRHSEHGWVVYADKARDGDLGPDYVARIGGGWGRARLLWGTDLHDLLRQAVPAGLRYPQLRATALLAAYAFRIAPAAEQQAVEVLLALESHRLGDWLADLDGADLSVRPA